MKTIIPFKIRQKVRVLKQNEAGAWIEYGQGIVLGFAYSKGSSEPTWIYYFDKDWPSSMADYPELIPISVPRIKIVKY